MFTTLGITTSKITGHNIMMSAVYVPLVGFSSFYNFSWHTLTPLATLLVIDFLTGLIKAYVLDKSELKSYKAISGVIAKSMIILIPIVFLVIGKQVDYDLTGMVDAIITMLVLAESYSIIANIRSIITRKKVEEIDAISFVLKKISSIIENLLK